MTYCPECGSEVAPENTFCAYCGIALTPVITPPAKTEVAASPDADNSKNNSAAPVRDFADRNVPNEFAEPNHLDATGDLVTPVIARPETPETPEWAVEPVQTKPESVSNPPALDEAIPSWDEPFRHQAFEDETFRGTPPSEVETIKSKPSAAQTSFAESTPNASASPEGNALGNEAGALGIARENQRDLQSDFKNESESNLKNEFEARDADLPSIPDSPIPDSPIAKSTSAESLTEQSEAAFQPNAADNEPDSADFQSTIPYVPLDFESGQIFGRTASAENPGNADAPSTPILDSNVSEANVLDLKPVNSETPSPVLNGSESAISAVNANDSAHENASPIAKPDAPVGGSAHDSLEPKFVSVRIYQPEDPIGATGEDESLHDSQTLLGQPAPKIGELAKPAESPVESRGYTSPNMSKDDTDGRAKAKLKPLAEGTVLNGRYEIVRKIGGGGMGAVYLASDRNLGGVLRAVKEMVQSYIEDAQQEKAVSDFKRESVLLSSLEHQSIPTIYDYFYDEGEARFYLVMKYISGGDLAGRLRAAAEGRIDEKTVTEWAIQVADVLDYLHNRQPPIIYRDLKPSNVMIDGNSGRAMLIDFGIARWVNKEEKGVTAVGTMGYAPPELFSGNVEPRSDIYSLGSTMFHLLTGADPQSNPLLIFDFQKNPRPRQINSALSDQMEQILMRSVEYSFDKRFTSAAELRDHLAMHLDNLRTGALTYGARDKSIPGVSPATSARAADELVFCGFCGQKIIATDMFCPFCGAQQPLAAHAAGKQAAFVQPKPTARIMIVSTNELNAPMFNLEKDTNLVGRRDPMSNIFPEVDLSKFDPQTKISRKHARIWREMDAFMLEDLGSSNGTVLITGKKEPQRLVKNQPHVLANGDKIRVGDTTLHFIVN